MMPNNKNFRKPTQPSTSNYTASPCQVKTKYLGKWDPRTLIVCLQQNKLEMNSSSGKKKSYPLDKINFHPIHNNKQISLQVPGGRTYEIKANQSLQQALHDIQYYQMSKDLANNINELTTPVPKKLNYFATVRSLSYQQGYVPQHKSSIIIVKDTQNQIVRTRPKQFQRVPSYINTTDWRKDNKKGGVVFINDSKKSMISKMIKYIVSRVISTGSFMGISFPTFAMKPQTILQTYCKCLGAVPLILDNCSNYPLDRIKAFNAIIQTISVLFNDIEKPFNPTIGQTYQGEIGGYPVYAQQISHHPPVTAFFLDGKNYVLHGSLQLNANLSLNSAVGLFYGQVVLEFDDGGVIKGRMPSGVLSGVVFGQTRFGPDGALYSYDPINHIVCSYQVKEKDILIGTIGKLKPKAYEKFMSMIDSKSKEKYQKFKNIPQKQFDKVLSKIQIAWTQYVIYDGKTFFDFRSKQNLAIKVTQNIEQIGQKLLPSDTSYRNDVKLREQLKMEQSQNEKQKIQQQQRSMRKLRERTNGIAHRNSLK